MDQPVVERLGDLVAPLAGSVDRNTDGSMYYGEWIMSLPSRGAWIEIGRPGRGCRLRHVAPLAGSVDRN